MLKKYQRNKKQKLAVIMAVYYGDKPLYLSEAIKSIFNQTVTPDQFIIVCDGPISKKLHDVINAYLDIYPIKVYFLKENKGRGAARNFAIQKSDADLIFIMDADDICLPERIEKQLKFLNLNQADIIGGIIEEFKQQPGDLKKVRNVPEMHESVLKFVPFRTPFNHVTIMFTKKLFLEIGGYKELNYVEDWDFAARALLNGSIFYNLQETLVYARVNEKRDYNYNYLKEELNLIRFMYLKDLANFKQTVISIIMRCLKFSMPSLLIKHINLLFLRKRI